MPASCKAPMSYQRHLKRYDKGIKPQQKNAKLSELQPYSEDGGKTPPKTVTNSYESEKLTSPPFLWNCR